MQTQRHLGQISIRRSLPDHFNGVDLSRGHGRADEIVYVGVHAVSVLAKLTGRQRPAAARSEFHALGDPDRRASGESPLPAIDTPSVPPRYAMIVKRATSGRRDGGVIRAAGGSGSWTEAAGTPHYLSRSEGTVSAYERASVPARCQWPAMRSPRCLQRPTDYPSCFDLARSSLQPVLQVSATAEHPGAHAPSASRQPPVQ
jgi:hypothetical protein